MSNDAHAGEKIISAIESLNPAKPFYLSKTFLVNVIALLALVFPAVREWAAAEPEAPVIILAFVNLVLRTVTRQAVRFSKDETTGIGGASGGGSRGSLLPLALFCLAAACLLPGCAGYPVNASVYHRLDDGSKVGIVYRGK